MSWIETDSIIFGMFLLFLLLLWTRARAASRPVSHWQRVLPTFVLLMGCGLFLALMLVAPYEGLHLQNSLNPVPALASGFGFAGFVVFWAILSHSLTVQLFSPGGALCDQQLQHGRGLLARLARKVFGPGDAVPPASEISDVPTLGLSRGK